MRLSNYGAVAALVTERARLLVQRDDSSFDILIRGELQHDDFVTVIAPAIRLELGRRIADIETKLRKLGVDVDVITV